MGGLCRSAGQKNQEQPVIYREIVSHYEDCLDRHGVLLPHLAVDWPNQEDAARRYDLMLKMIQPPGQPCELLDFGCGLAGLKGHIDQKGLDHIAYTGMDISDKFISASRGLYSGAEFLTSDVLTEKVDRRWDWVICNGVLTEKRSLDFAAMWDYAQQLLESVFRLCRLGLAFNVMSSYVDYEKCFLFHLPPSLAIDFVCSRLSPKFSLHHRYCGLYEYTIFVLR